MLTGICNKKYYPEEDPQYVLIPLQNELGPRTNNRLTAARRDVKDLDDPRKMQTELRYSVRLYKGEISQMDFRKSYNQHHDPDCFSVRGLHATVPRRLLAMSTLSPKHLSTDRLVPRSMTGI